MAEKFRVRSSVSLPTSVISSELIFNLTRLVYWENIADFDIFVGVVSDLYFNFELIVGDSHVSRSRANNWRDMRVCIKFGREQCFKENNGGFHVVLADDLSQHAAFQIMSVWITTSGKFANDSCIPQKRAAILFFESLEKASDFPVKTLLIAIVILRVSFP